MPRNEILMILAFALLVYSSEIDDIEPQKRDAGKSTSLNTISGGSQKQDYYSVYQNSNPQSNQPKYSYQNQPPNSFYPSQTASQYYINHPSSDTSATYTHQAQPNPITHSSQFVPINFVPNTGYHSKYHVVQPKSVGNVQYAVIQQPNAVPYPNLPHGLFSQSPSQVHQFGTLPYNMAPNYQVLGGPYSGHPSPITLLTQPNSVYNNLLYQNPVQGFYNQYQTNTQPKIGVTYASSGQQDYEKLPGSISGTKEDNEVGTQNTDYTSQSDLNYKNAYSNRNSYTKS